MYACECILENFSTHLLVCKEFNRTPPQKKKKSRAYTNHLPIYKPVYSFVYTGSLSGSYARYWLYMAKGIRTRPRLAILLGIGLRNSDLGKFP